MSAEIFLEYRARISGMWVDVESCVLALEARIARQKRGSNQLKWATFGFGLLTGGAGIEVLSPAVTLVGANAQYVVSVLAFITGGLSAAAPLLAFDNKIAADTKAQHGFLDLQSDIKELLSAMSRKELGPDDDKDVSILEDKVGKEIRKAAYDTQAFRESANDASRNKAFLQRVWLGPEDEAIAVVEAQGMADLQPLTRG